MQIKELVKTDFISLDKNETISKLLGKLKQDHQRNVLVFDNKKCLGIVSKRSLLKSKVMAQEMKVEKIIRKVAVIDEDADVLEAAYLMFNVDTNVLPVSRKGKVFGVLRIFDLLGQLKKYEEIKKLKINDAKILKLKTFKETERIGKIINEMNTFSTYDMPIVDEKGKLVGLVSVSDIWNKFVSPVVREKGMKTDMTKTKGFTPNAPDITGMPVSSFGSFRNVYFEDVNKSLVEAVNEMRKHDLMSLVVTKDSKPFGMLTANNVLRVMAALYKGPAYNIKITGLKKTNLEPYQVANLKALLSRHAEVLDRMLKNEFLLEVKLKEYSKTGKKHKWLIEMKAVFPGRMVSAKEHDWDLETALHKTFNNLKKRIQGYFRGNERGWDKEYE
ncbi:CBS domain-containing protein [Candidatus Woesearchaeota archaeon]|nr:CBS domain-containing protein [Candidatus Woesearchaeota archaeon]